LGTSTFVCTWPKRSSSFGKISHGCAISTTFSLLRKGTMSIQNGLAGFVKVVQSWTKCISSIWNRFFSVVIYADSMLTQDNMGQPEVAFCFILGASPRQQVSGWVAPTPQSRAWHSCLIIVCL
jgi:hypothetical protein